MLERTTPPTLERVARAIYAMAQWYLHSANTECDTTAHRADVNFLIDRETARTCIARAISTRASASHRTVSAPSRVWALIRKSTYSALLFGFRPRVRPQIRRSGLSQSKRLDQHACSGSALCPPWNSGGHNRWFSKAAESILQR